MQNIVVIAHDVKKPELVSFLKERKEWIPDVNFIATGRTAEFLEENNLEVRHLSPGKYGGYIEINEMIKRKEVDIVIFMRDPMIHQSHHEDIQELLKACNMHNIPLATNYASAELLILGLIRKEDYERSKNVDEI